MDTAFVQLDRRHIFFIGSLFAFFQFHAISAQNGRPTPVEIISQVVAHTPLWEKLPREARSINAYYILDHGVELEMTTSLRIQGKPVISIDKEDINGLNGEPYFLFHTLNIESTKALVRTYLVRNTADDEKTEFAEFFFDKRNGQWILTSTSL